MYEANLKIYEFDSFRLDVTERQLLKGNKTVAIPPKAFDLLLALVENSGSLVERESLYARVWPESIVEDANLTVYISAIRKALNDPSCITTVSGHGYRFNWPVKEVNGTNGRGSLQTYRIRPESSDSGANHFAPPEASEESIVEPEPVTRRVGSNRNSLIVGVIGVLLMTALGIGSYLYSRSSAKQIESIAKPEASLSNGQQQLATSGTASPEAYQLYLKGRYHWTKWTPEDLRKSIEYFDGAIALDPNYAGAYAGLADAYALYFGFAANSSQETLVKAKEAALKALSLDEGSAEAHASLGHVMLQGFEFVEAEHELKRSIELDPDYATARHLYGLLLRSLGRFDEMFAQCRRAMELEPLSPLLTEAYASSFSWARRYDEALVLLNMSLELEADRPFAHASIAYTYWGKGDHAKAVHHFSTAKELRGRGDVAAKMRKSFTDGGWHAFLRASLADPAIMPWPYERARYYTALGQNDRAFEQLNKAYEVREPRLRNLKIDAFLDGLRGDPRYAELIRKIGFPE